MTNDELRQAIEDASKQIRSTAADSPAYAEFVGHLRALLSEQQRRAVSVTAPPVAPSAPLWIHPVVVHPTWAPRPPWEPPWTVTCQSIGAGE